MTNTSDATTKKWPAFASFNLFSPLPRDECVARLAATTRRESSGLVGSVRMESFCIRWRYQPRYGRVLMRNQCQPYLFGKLRDHNGGTSIQCRFIPMHPVLMVAVPFWCCVAAVLAMGPHWREAVIIIALAALLFFMSTVCWVEREWIMEELIAAINARRL